MEGVVSERPRPTVEDLLKGEMPDGSLPDLISRHLDHRWDKPIPGGRKDRNEAELRSDHLHQRTDLDRLNDLEMARAFCRLHIQRAMAAVEAEDEQKPGQQCPGTPPEQEPAT